MSVMGLGVIGTGSRAIGYLQRVFNALVDEKAAQVVGVMDANSVRAAEGGKDLRAAHVYKDHQALLEADGLDAVFIMTPDNVHAPLVVDALNAGKHVFCEKPMATTLEACNAIAKAAEKAPGIFFAGHNVRFGLGRTMIREIRKGRAGPIRMVFGRRFVRGAKYWHRWHRSRAGSGGLLVHKGCHWMDQMNWYADGHPKFISAFGGQDVHTPDRRPNAPRRCLECDDHCEHYKDIKAKDHSVRYFLNAEHEDGYLADLCVYAPGADVFDNAVVNVQYDNGVRGNYMECHFAPISDLATELGVVGDDGMLHLRHSAGNFDILFTCAKTQTTENIPLDLEKPVGDEATIRAFVDCARKGERPESDVEAGWDSAVMGIVAEESARSGRTMEILREERTFRPVG